MTRTSLYLSAFICFTLLTPATLHAAEKTTAKAEKPAEKKVELRKSGKVEAQSSQNGPAPGPLKDWIDAENALIDPLSDKDKESFFILRNKYSIMRATRVVERDVKNAVKSCGDKNSDMKDKMNARFKQWQNAVDPILDTAKKQLDKDIDAQKIVDPDKARKVFKLNDEAYEFSEKQIVKNPVSSPEACKGLLSSMDRTEDNMVQLLQQTLMPESVIRQRAAKAAKAKSADKKPAAKTE